MIRLIELLPGTICVFDLLANSNYLLFVCCKIGDEYRRLNGMKMRDNWGMFGLEVRGGEGWGWVSVFYLFSWYY